MNRDAKLHAVEFMHPVHVLWSPPHTPHRSTVDLPPRTPLQSCTALVTESVFESEEDGVGIVVGTVAAVSFVEVVKADTPLVSDLGVGVVVWSTETAVVVGVVVGAAVVVGADGGTILHGTVGTHK